MIETTVFLSAMESISCHLTNVLSSHTIYIPDSFITGGKAISTARNTDGLPHGVL